VTATTDTSPHADIAHRLLDGRVTVTAVAVSPDGARTAFVVAAIDVEKNKTFSRVWLDSGDGKPLPVTAGDFDGNPAWSPDGSRLAFTSRRGEKKGDSTLHVLPISVPGEMRTLCTRKDGLGNVAWSPDGAWIAFTSRTPDVRYEAEDTSWQAPRKVERFFSRLNGEDWVFDRPQHVYVVASAGTGTERNLTPGGFQHTGLSWLRDSSGLVVSAPRHDTWDEDLCEDLYVVPLDGEIRALTEQTGVYTNPAVSPDGTTVACLAVHDTAVFPQNAHVAVVDIATGGTPRFVSEALDRTFSCTSNMQGPVWENDETLLATAEDRGDTHLYRLRADGSDAPEQLTKAAMTVHRFDAAGGTIRFAASCAEHPAELSGLDGAITALTTGFQSWEKFAVPTKDGHGEIDAWIMRPVDFDETKRYPVLLNVHGGPFTQYGEFFFDEAQMQAAAGFVVLMSNPRGGSGREESWGQAILGPEHPIKQGTGWGSVDVDDVLAVLDHALAAYSFCDGERVGMLGGSYGGYMATWLAGRHGDRFRGICSERAVSNLLSEEWSSDISTAFRTEHGANIVENPALYVERSPSEFAKDITVPMLLIHSEEDYRCPIAQAEEIWVTLKLLGRDVTFYRFPGENHELSRSGSPLHRKQRAEIILDWFSDKLAG
jgi:dipeptidyl aminopeptidase/acylaminoacyl peptidase